MTFRTEIGTPIPEWDAAEKKTRRTLLWLLMALVVFLILFGCGTCSTIATNPEMTNIAIASELEADYGYWRKVSFSAVNPAIIVEAAKDGFKLNRMDTGPSVGCFIPGEDCVTPTADPTTTPPVPTNTPVEEISPMATMTSISSPQVVWVPPTEEASSGSGSAGDTGPPPAPTATPTNTNTPVDTDTPPPPPPPEDTATPEPPTATPTMEFNMIAPGPQVNTGEPDGSYMNVGQGNAFYLDISGNPIILEETPNPDPDFVYYERENGNSNQVLLDWVVLQIAQDLSDTWHIVFYWGDQIPDANTNIDAYATDGDGELDNEPLPMETPASPLVGTPDLNTGITIDVDSKVATPGVYPWLMVGAPSGSGDPAEVDAIQVLPTATP